MPLDRTPASRMWTTSVAIAAAVVLTACADDMQEDGEIIGGPAAAEEAVTEDLKIVSVELEFPEDGLHEEGDDVTLYAALTNTGTTAYQLVDVVGEDFADARLVPLDGDAGTIEVPENDNAYLEPEGPPTVILEDLQTSLRSSQSIEVTFVFEDAAGDLGEVTVEAPVAADPPGQGGFQAPEDPSPEDPTEE